MFNRKHQSLCLTEKHHLIEKYLDVLVEIENALEEEKRAQKSINHLRTIVTFIAAMKSPRQRFNERVIAVKSICGMSKILYLLLACMLICRSSVAQQSPVELLDKLEASFKRSAAARQQVDLFLHVDKQIYTATATENIWFTARVLNQEVVPDQHTLFCVLVEKRTDKIVACERFEINKGVARGAIFLNDSLCAGEYSLLAYTNTFLTYPDQMVFQQPLIIRVPGKEQFKIVYDSAYKDGPAADEADMVRFRYRITKAGGSLAAGVSFDYKLKGDDDQIIQQDCKDTDKNGEIIFELSKADIYGKNVELLATITDKLERQFVKDKVPLKEKRAIIRFFPEGGRLVHNRGNSMGVEIKNGAGVPVIVRGELQENGRSVAAFATDQMGMAVIKWLPQWQYKYTIRLKGVEEPLTEYRYRFPKVEPVGYSLHLPEAVAGDSSLFIEIGVPPGNDTCHLIAHNNNGLFFSGTLVVVNGQAALRMPVTQIPEGVCTLTLFDAAGEPQVERAVFIRRREALKVEMVTDKPVYKRRDSLQLTVKITNSRGLPVQGSFSLACVQSPRIDSVRAVDIVRYSQYDRFLSRPVVLPAPAYANNPENIDRLLLTRFWTGTQWKSINDPNKPIAPKDSLKKACDVGVVDFNGSRLTKPVSFVLMAGPNASIFSTDSVGEFELPLTALRVGEGQKAMIMPVGKQKRSEYKITMYDGCHGINLKLANIKYPSPGYRQADLLVLDQADQARMLKAVTVKAKSYTSLSAGASEYQGASYDWICAYNTLNCTLHPKVAKPENGEWYVRYEVGSTEKVLYKAPFVQPQLLQQVAGVKKGKEFAEFGSTIFWSYQVTTNEQGEAVINFPTSNLTGKFICTAQAYTTEGVASGATSFRVTE